MAGYHTKFEHLRWVPLHDWACYCRLCARIAVSSAQSACAWWDHVHGGIMCMVIMCMVGSSVCKTTGRSFACCLKPALLAALNQSLMLFVPLQVSGQGELIRMSLRWYIPPNQSTPMLLGSKLGKPYKAERHFHSGGACRLPVCQRPRHLLSLALSGSSPSLFFLPVSSSCKPCLHTRSAEQASTHLHPKHTIACSFTPQTNGAARRA